MAAALNQQQQLKNEATKMGMRVPLFYGNKKEDTMNIKDFIARFESACNAMGLAVDAEKCNLFGSYLRGRASAMWMNAQFQGVEVDTWINVKEHFMIRYRGKTETTTFCHQIPRLVQDKTELRRTMHYGDERIRRSYADSTGHILQGRVPSLGSSRNHFSQRRRAPDDD